MSYKLNQQNPMRAMKMKFRRARQHVATSTRVHKVTNKYILSGSEANVRQPQDIIWEKTQLGLFCV